MAMVEKVDKLRKLSKEIKVGENIQIAPLEGQSPDRDYFEALMRQRAQKSERIDEAKAMRSTPMEEAVRMHGNGVEKSGDPKKIMTYVETTIAQIDEVRNTLSQPDLRLKGSVQNLLRTKLTGINEDIRVAFKKVGVDYINPTEPTGQFNPILRFLGLLTNSQTAMEQLGQDVQNIQNTPDVLSPANLIALEIKTHHIQQQVEFFSNLLNKSLEGMKTIMNVQV